MSTPAPGGGAGPGRRARLLEAGQLLAAATALLTTGYRLALVGAHDDGSALRAVYLFLRAQPEDRVELHVRMPATAPRVPSLASVSFPGGRFEREMHDLFGVIPDGHPLPRRLVRHPRWPAGWYPLRRGAGPAPGFTEVEPYPFLAVQGPGVYEIPVGPVHAGLIEPGHFRFSVVGETILKLKVRLWFVHRGAERLFEGREPSAGVELAERISGDTAVGHALAYCLAVEDALGLALPSDGQLLRSLLLELERLYNHICDLGALAGDTGYSIGQAHALRLRERLLRLNETVTGHRLLRGAITPGRVCVRALPDPETLRQTVEEAEELAEIILANPGVRDRFTGTAVLAAEQAREIGCLGYVGRASGLPGDARWDHPLVAPIGSPVTHSGGDVLARFFVRRDEIRASARLVAAWAPSVPTSASAPGPPRPPATPPGPLGRLPRSGVGIVEGWRGTIVHRVELDGGGRLTRVKVVDPSWFNWPALPVALAGAIVPDFPLANKSFNLSYAGNDL